MRSTRVIPACARYQLLTGRGVDDSRFTRVKCGKARGGRARGMEAMARARGVEVYECHALMASTVGLLDHSRFSDFSVLYLKVFVFDPNPRVPHFSIGIRLMPLPSFQCKRLVYFFP